MSAVNPLSTDVALNDLPYVPWVFFPGTDVTGATGGDSLTTVPNQHYQTGDVSWVLTSTALVLLMVPGVGFFYSGLARRKSALSLIWLSIVSVAVVSFQWFFWGYSLAFSHSAGLFLGNLKNMGLRDVLGAPSVGSNGIPDLLFCIYQCMFAAITVALAVGAVAERGRMLPCVVFMFVWSTLIYDAIACWTWNPSGWVYRLGGLDFAGGTPVHISSGCAALAYSYALGSRTGHGTSALNYRPHNITHVVIGTVFLWVGWFGFNAGSALGANLRAAMAAVVTNLAACVGGLAWMLVDYRLEKKWSAVGFCSGVVAGLVAITPGSGYVPAWAAILYGLCAGIGCNFATKLKYWIQADDALDIFAVHAIGGLIGNILTGFFAADYIASLDGHSSIPGGWLNHNWVQPAIQLADSVSGAAYSFGGSMIILTVISLLSRILPVLRLRVDRAEEEMGIDDVEIGEFAYDYVELTREVKPRSLHGQDEEDMEEMSDATSNRSHSQATMIDQKQPMAADSYKMRTISREGEYSSYATSPGMPVGQAQ
ncbi:ammonium transporter 1 [Teratosphaeria nubilosa]|uniref:Ammonium transporter n=1 Tax=Teratosphaeria nubilosa TaxID=161662 RepID=A0A6G1LDH1_9PEZI|nr:ammonium transporter 1 [Teratosphaeria nubilosa]